MFQQPIRSSPAKPTSGSPVLVEYSSPNTNKPLHLGHIRNNLLGYSVCQILQADGNNVVKVNIVNDRGIHICKSMLAWQKYGFRVKLLIVNWSQRRSSGGQVLC